jgi:SET domain
MSAPAFAVSHLARIAHFGFATLYQNNVTGERSLHASIPYQEGQVIAKFEASEILSAPNKYTVQVDDERHIILEPEFLQYINHSCSPNTFFDTGLMQISCLKDIATGDELTFFYPSTEYAMAAPFNCLCGSNDCLHVIQGAAFLSSEIIHRYKFTDFIMQKLNIPYLQKV